MLTSSASVIRSPPKSAMNAAHGRGCCTARLPITTRPTPASNISSRCVAFADAAGDLELAAAHRGRAAAISSCWRGLRSRAPSRSTTCAQAAPAAAKPASASAGSVEIAGDGFEPPLGEPHAAAADQVHGGIDDHDARKAFEEARAGRAAALRVELGAQHVAAAHDGGNRAAISRRRRGCAARRRRRSRARNRHSRRWRGRASSARRFEAAPAHVRDRAAGRGLEPADPAGDEAEAGRRRPPRSPRTAIACRGRCRAAAGSVPVSVSRRPSAVDPPHRIARRADAGQDDAVGRARSRPDRRSRATAAPSRSRAISTEPILP